ncbi:Hypothetical predicted protein [Octopus vulgaris]|uniref:Uncharacterized protein n=1 Tax=Octopus vulgaris TaxID=6645 RepID=A0AA36BEG4_OCTVU|nr:Hypothetical predicted protein [Octopus vulgaris]
MGSEVRILYDSRMRKTETFFYFFSLPFHLLSPSSPSPLISSLLLHDIVSTGYVTLCGPVDCDSLFCSIHLSSHDIEKSLRRMLQR